MKKIFWGFIILFFKITFKINQSSNFLFDPMFGNETVVSASITILPAFIGWIVISLGVKELEEKSHHFKEVMPWFFGYIVFEILSSLHQWFFLTAFNSNLFFSYLLSILTVTVSFFIQYKIIMGYIEMEKTYNEDFKGNELLNLLKINAVSTALTLLFLYTVVIPLICGVISLVVMIMMIIRYYKASETYNNIKIKGTQGS